MSLTKIETDGIKDDAVTSGKIPANAVGTSEIADTSVTLAKLEHGTSSNDGKFLRANNGADPSFETVSIPAGTTINNNADNRVITGSGTANTLNGESNVQINSSGIMTIGNDPTGAASLGGDLNVANTNGGTVVIGDTGSGEYLKLHGSGSGAFVGSKSNDPLMFFTNDIANERMRINSSGNVGINQTNPNKAKLHVVGDNTDGDIVAKFKSGSGANSKVYIALVSGYPDTANDIEGHAYIGAERSGSGNKANIIFAPYDGGSAVTERLRIRHGGGICFNGDTAAANALDDYEEGTFTLTVVSGGFSSINGTGRYTKIGRICHFTGDYTLSGSGNGGTLRISGLPFNSYSEWQACSGYAQYYNNEGSQQASFAVVGSMNEIRVVEYGNEAAGNDFNAGYMNITGTYLTNT